MFWIRYWIRPNPFQPWIEIHNIVAVTIYGELKTSFFFFDREKTIQRRRPRRSHATWRFKNQFLGLFHILRRATSLFPAAESISLVFYWNSYMMEWIRSPAKAQFHLSANKEYGRQIPGLNLKKCFWNKTNYFIKNFHNVKLVLQNQ